MEGRVVVVTGASSGIGEAAARELAELGALVVPVGRNEQRLRKVAQEVGGEPLFADFSSLAAVRELAETLRERHERIDVLVNNAGLVSGRRRLSADGYELTLAVNHLAPFLLTNLLLDRLRESGGRVVTTSSGAHHGGLIDLDDLQLERRRFSGNRAYANSKLANVLFTRELARREGAIAANCFHPGVIRTRLARGANPLVRVGATVAAPVLASARSGARTLVWLASSTEAGEESGGYFERERPGRLSAQAQDDALARGLWERSAELVGLA